MFVKILDKIPHIFFSLLVFLTLAKNLSSEEIHLHFPEELLMVEFDKHILPRFKFKTQITINAVNSFENSDATNHLLKLDMITGLRVRWSQSKSLCRSDTSYSRTNDAGLQNTTDIGPQQ